MTEESLIFFYKKPGETPLEALGRLRREKPELKETKLSYAGRLDPLAEGELLVLVGETCKEREKYLGLDKTYTLDILFGLSTDTGDVLGKIQERISVSEETKEEIKNNLVDKLKLFLGKRIQPYPLFSSKPIEGKPLFQIAKEKEVEEIERPEKEIEIYEIKLLDFYTLGSYELEKKIYEKINSVRGDFRQEEILADWQNFFEKENSDFLLARISVFCSSGTYMRVLAEEIGKAFSLPSLAFHIKREKIHLYQK